MSTRLVKDVVGQQTHNARHTTRRLRLLRLAFGALTTLESRQARVCAVGRHGKFLRAVWTAQVHVPHSRPLFNIISRGKVANAVIRHNSPSLLRSPVRVTRSAFTMAVIR